MYSLVVIADLHCGSVFGLTPPGWYQRNNPSRYAMQKEAWEQYIRIARRWSRPDVLLVNGDAIDGSQAKQGGAELLTPDRSVQAEIAEYAIKIWKADKIVMTYGTPYHVSGGAEDFEYKLAQDVGATIEGRYFFSVGGLTIDARHKIGSSSIPHGRGTPLLREVMWSMLKEVEDAGPRADMIIRSHVHYELYCEPMQRIAQITPCLQLARGRHGSRECSGVVDWGALRFTINKRKVIGRDKDICRLRANRPRVIKIK